jgi:hypothetical protein
MMALFGRRRTSWQVIQYRLAELNREMAAIRAGGLPPEVQTAYGLNTARLRRAIETDGYRLILVGGSWIAQGTD